jgi:hypothetical protein
MMERTTTKYAPWHLIPANNKPYGRIAALRILADRLGKDVSLEPRPIDPDLLKEAKRTLGLSASDTERASQAARQKGKLKRNRSKTEQPTCDGHGLDNTNPRSNFRSWQTIDSAPYRWSGRFGITVRAARDPRAVEA